MNRIGAGLVAIALILSLGASSAAAQYPDPNRPDAVGSGSVSPCNSGSITVNGAAPGATEPGTIDSSIPVNDTADANGTLDYAFAAPCTFVLNASHTLTFTNGGSLTFCVNRSGAVAPCSTLTTGTGGAAIPRTGADYVDDGLRAAAVLLTGGALLVLWRRRAAAALTTAS